ncbi:hypothetical protein SAMN04515618_10442 [Collimonas sp. OK307]|uniref:hypothetical protein n=1 Tax=Collimonas sp. OK307 TaxID=1801620 RepID=UPI0008EA571C|nr:hypothetical protein [Collimonas sp. OK307]SFH83674.1 hypothetical protein SAMN04515618_10442 [Collimonas sp. OK307]
MKLIYRIILLCLATSSAQGAAIGGYRGDAPNVELRISINGQAVLGERELEELSLSATEQELRVAFDQSLTSLTRGQSVQLTVEMIESNGIRSDVTANPAMFYDAVGRDTLSVSNDGFVTALPDSSGSVIGQLLVLYNTPEKSGFNYVYFDIDPNK